MRTFPSAVLLLALAASAAGAQDTLRVLHAGTPKGPSASSTVTVTFDRPVAGALDRSIDAARIVRYAPRLPGRLAWRDPVTIRFTPDEPLPPGTELRFVVDTTFRALDGSRLAAPYAFTVRVPGPTMLHYEFGRSYRDSTGRMMRDDHVRVAYSAPVDLERVARGARVELGSCGGATRTVALRPIVERPIEKSDPWEIQQAGGWDRDTSGDRFRRYVELAPVDSLPPGCGARLVLPTSGRDSAYGAEESFAVTTPPAFEVGRVGCEPLDRPCGMTHLVLTLTAPITRDELTRHVHFDPALSVEGPPGASESIGWLLGTSLAPHTTYTVTLDSTLRDVYGRRVRGTLRYAVATGDYLPSVTFPNGAASLRRTATRIPIRAVNVAAVRVVRLEIPAAYRAAIAAAAPYEVDSLVQELRARSDTIIVPLDARFDVPLKTELTLPTEFASGPLVALHVDAARVMERSRDADSATRLLERSVPPVAAPRTRPTYGATSHWTLLQFSDLAVHAKWWPDGVLAIVTGLGDGRPRAGVSVVRTQPDGRVVGSGVTDSTGVARLDAVPDGWSLPRPPRAVTSLLQSRRGGAASVLVATLEGDTAIAPIEWRAFGYSPVRLDPGAWDQPRVAGALVTDRGIYRPGEMLYVEAIVRHGPLGAMEPPVAGERLHLRVGVPTYWARRPDERPVLDTVVTTSAFGTAFDSLLVPATLRPGSYEVTLSSDDGREIATEPVTVAEYRPPTFLVTADADSTPRVVGDTLRAVVSGRYLFGAPMGRAVARWRATFHPMPSSEIRVPGADGWSVGDEEDRDDAPVELGGRVDTLGAGGRLPLRVPITPEKARAGRVELAVAVTDLDRQAVTASLSVPVTPARLYVLARKAGGGWLWPVGAPVAFELRTVGLDGADVAGTRVVVSVVRRGWSSLFGSWKDTVDRVDTLRSDARPVRFAFTPRRSGEYLLRFVALDAGGDSARTVVSGWAAGGALATWYGQRPNELHLVAESENVGVGDETRLAFESPFDQGDAWLTIEREGVIERRHFVAHAGTNVVPLRIGATFVPNVFVSVLLVRDRADGAALPDSSSQLVRAGYVELHVGTAPRRLAVAVRPDAREYGPRDSARFDVRITGADGRGARSQVTLWAVDEGVLALTDQKPPDVLAKILDPRPLGVALTSTLLAAMTNDARVQFLRLRGAASALQEVVVTNVADVSAYAVSAASGAAMPFTRTEFRSTAFFVAGATTDASGTAHIAARLPDNLTTYRVIAVAVGADDRFGTGDTAIVATRAVVARPTLPRFVRPADSLVAGAVVNARDGAARTAIVDAEARGIVLQGEPRARIALATGRGGEARFALRVPPRDSVTDSVVVRLRASAGSAADAVETRLPVRPDFYPRTHTAFGALRASDDVTLRLPANIDPARSRLTIRLGTSPVAAMLVANRWLRGYPFDCTEQITSVGLAELAVWRATGRDARTADAEPRRRVQRFADELARRQRADGAFRYWRDAEWSSPWLTAQAGLFLLAARDAGIDVPPAVIGEAKAFLSKIAGAPVDTGGANRYERAQRRLALGGRVAAVEFLRRAGAAEPRAEDALLAVAPRMYWEDRLRLAELLAQRSDRAATAGELVDAAWSATSAVGRRVDLPDSAHAPRDFPSRIAPAARLLTATLALRPDQPRLGGLLETLLAQGRAESGAPFGWNTQDYSAAVMALAELSHGGVDSRMVRVSAGDRVLLQRVASDTGASESVPLSGLLGAPRGATVPLTLHLSAARGDRPIYYALSVTETPSAAPVTPDARGIVVERWYERYADGRPITTASAGELVRVRLRVTVPADRAFVAVEDPLPAGLEPVDLSLHTSRTLAPFASEESERAEREGDRERDGPEPQAWLYGRWMGGWWSPWEHTAQYDDRVVYFARMLWAGSYTASYIARATTTGSFTRPPAHAEEMYDPGVSGRSDGGRFGVREDPR